MDWLRFRRGWVHPLATYVAGTLVAGNLGGMWQRSLRWVFTGYLLVYASARCGKACQYEPAAGNFD